MVESAFTFNSLFRHCAKWMLTRSKCFQPGEGPSRGLFRDCEIFADGSFAALLKKNLHSYSLGEITRPSPPGVRGQIMCKALDLQTKILWIYSFHIPSGLELAQVTDYDLEQRELGLGNGRGYSECSIFTMASSSDPIGQFRWRHRDRPYSHLSSHGLYIPTLQLLLCKQTFSIKHSPIKCFRAPRCLWTHSVFDLTIFTISNRFKTLKYMPGMWTKCLYAETPLLASIN